MFDLISNSIQILIFFTPFITIFLYPILLIILSTNTKLENKYSKYVYSIIFALVLNIVFISLIIYQYSNETTSGLFFIEIISILNILCLIILPIDFFIRIISKSKLS